MQGAETEFLNKLLEEKLKYVTTGLTGTSRRRS